MQRLTPFTFNQGPLFITPIKHSPFTVEQQAAMMQQLIDRYVPPKQ